MNTYKDGYQAGWTSYFENCKTTIQGSFDIGEARRLAERAGRALPPQQRGDYWLGYHHGRTAAKTCLTKQVQQVA